MKKRLLSLVTAAAVALSLNLNVFAAPGQPPSRFTYEFFGSEIYAAGDITRQVLTLKFTVPCDGEYYEIWNGELREGDVVDIISSSFSPSYVQLVVEIMKDDGGYAAMTPIHSGGTSHLNVRQSGSYSLRLKALDREISGLIQVDL